MNFNCTLCENLNISKLTCKCISKDNKKINTITDTIIEDINELLVDSEFNRNYICTHILNKIVQLTNSEYGLLMQVVHDEQNNIELHAHGITNMAWNFASREFYRQHIDNPLIFTNIDHLLFKDVIQYNKVIIENTYDTSRNIIQKGHPPIKRFLGIPVTIANHPILVVGLCNKIQNYEKKDADKVNKLMNVLAYLFIDLKN